MPELPEVETVMRGLRPILEGRRLRRVVARRADLRWPLPERFVERLTGQRVERLERRAKYILCHLEGGDTLIAHLGMSGRMLIQPARANTPPGPHDHLSFETDDDRVVTFQDPRRFGSMDLWPRDTLAAYPAFRRLGPEPLAPAFTPAVLSAALANRHTPIKAALLDQKTVAGLGNIYVCEALWRAGISPRRLARTIPGARAERLVPAIKAVLNEAIAAGGSSLRDYVQASGELGYFQASFAVYGREGEECPGCTCDGVIRRIVQSGRSTFYCPKRQK